MKKQGLTLIIVLVTLMFGLVYVAAADETKEAMEAKEMKETKEPTAVKETEEAMKAKQMMEMKQLEAVAEKFVTSIPTHKMFLMPLQDLAAELEKEETNVVVVDVRPGTMFESGHIKGSMNIPLPTLVKDMGKISAKKTIAVVCTLDTNSAYAVAVLRMFGYDAWVVSGGIPGWEKMGKPLVK